MASESIGDFEGQQAEQVYSPLGHLEAISEQVKRLGASLDKYGKAEQYQLNIPGTHIAVPLTGFSFTAPASYRQLAEEFSSFQGSVVEYMDIMRTVQDTGVVSEEALTKLSEVINLFGEVGRLQHEEYKYCKSEVGNLKGYELFTGKLHAKVTKREEIKAVGKLIDKIRVELNAYRDINPQLVEVREG